MNMNISRRKNASCQPPPHAPDDYCAKLKVGFGRLRSGLQERYEQIFPDDREEIGRAVAAAETMAWATPFPALYLSALVHLRVAQIFYPQMAAVSASDFQS
jgi:hypothetical protein